MHEEFTTCSQMLRTVKNIVITIMDLRLYLNNAQISKRFWLSYCPPEIPRYLVVRDCAEAKFEKIIE